MTKRAPVIGLLARRRRIPAAPDEPAGRSVVLFAPGFDPGRCLAGLNRLGINTLAALPLLGAACCYCHDQSLERLAALPEVERVEPDFAVSVWGSAAAPAPVLVSPHVPWGVRRIGAPLVWPASRGAGVRVAVLDTGIDPTHPDLEGAVSPGFNAMVPGLQPLDDSGHGTHVAGTIAARGWDGGLAGVAPGADIYPVKAFDHRGRGLISHILAGLEWCIRHGMQVVNMSFGTAEESRILAAAVRRAHAAGAVLVAASGNDGGGSIDLPARLPEVIAVGATTRRNQLAWFSDQGPELDLLAPGHRIVSTWLRGRYRRISGTSMAAPHVSGAAALLLAAEPRLDPAAVLQRLQQTGESLPGLELRLVSAAAAVGQGALPNGGAATA